MAEAIRILGMPEDHIRTIVEAGLCSPASGTEFSFQDLVLLRAAEGLFRSVPRRRLRRALRAIAAQLPEGASASGLRIVAQGADVVVREGGTAWQPETGQTVLDFEPPAASSPAAAAPPRPERVQSAMQWFERALSLELEDPEAAMAAYLEAVEKDPDLVDAWVNLGRVAHDTERLPEAERCYRRALELSPDDPVAHYDIALVLEDLGRAGEAIVHYQKAVALDPTLADAHFNLGRLLSRTNRRADAIRHLSEYKRLTRE